MSLDKFRLDGLCAVVTGASKGLGQAMARALSSAGADVVLTSRKRAEAEAAAEELKSAGRKALGLQADVSDRSAIAELVRQAEAAFGKIDILVNNAGVGEVKPLLEVGDADWDPVMDINLKGALLCAQAVVPGMKVRRFGRIINVGSILSTVGFAGLGHYGASKHGLMGLTRSMALEWARHGITVNCICPGFFVTDMTRNVAGNTAAYNDVIAKTPVGRWGEPEDLDGGIVFLASRASGYVTGIALPVDGGWTAQ